MTRTFGAMASVEVAGESLVMVVAGDQDPDTTVSTVEILNRSGEENGCLEQKMFFSFH